MTEKLTVPDSISSQPGQPDTGDRQQYTANRDAIFQ
jgi:hypothetical protein